MQKLLTVKLIFPRRLGVTNKCLEGFKFVHNKSTAVRLHNINTQNEISYSKMARLRKKANRGLSKFEEVLVRLAVRTERLSLREFHAWQKYKQCDALNV